MNNKENMNEYDDQDDQDDLSSSNSFRARSNTWPLNRPDITVPSSGVCIDETLPEIELEDDDLFTTNENWATGMAENQDIMSWDPILNAQNQQQNQQQQPATIHHHHNHQQQPQPQQTQSQQRHHHHHHQPQQPQQQPQPQAQHQTHSVNQHQHHQHHHHHQQPQHHPPPPIPITQGHQRHQSIHIHNQQQQHHHRQDLHQHPQSDPFLDVVSNNPNNVMLTSHNIVQLPQHGSQLQRRLSPTQHPTHVQHQTLNSVHCLDHDEPNEYHIQQMHHLSLDNNQPSQPHENSHQDHYAPTLTSMCIHNPSTNLNNDTSYNIATNHHDPNHHHLQALSSASYDIDPQGEYELKAPHDETLGQHVEHQTMSQPSHHHHHHHPHVVHLQHHQQQQTHHQLQTTSSSLDNPSSGAQLLSSSLSTSGIGLSGDLEDLDYTHPLDSSILLSNPPHDDQKQKPQTAEGQSTDEAKPSNSTSNSKTKLNAPRRNAWGNMSYADLISQAINSTSDKRLTLSQIYDWMVQHVPYFKDKGDSNSSAGWKNSVRHNLSLHSRFKRLQNEGTGKSSWWTINPEANIGKCARRRAASMEASKYEKKRGRAKKKAEAIRQGLISYPSLSNSSLNGSTTALGHQDSHQAQSLNQFQNSSQTSQKSEQTQQQPQAQSHPQMKQEPQSQAQSQSQPQLQNLDQFADLQPPPVNRPQLQIQTLDHYVIDQPSQQQQQHLQHLQQSDAQSCEDLNGGHVLQQHDQSLFISQPTPQHQELRYEENNENNKIHQQPQQQQQQQQQYYYPFELSTAL